MRLLSLSCLVLLLGLVGCVTPRPAQPPPTQMAVSPELLARIKSVQQPELQTFQGKGRLTIMAPQGNYSGTGLIKGKFPSSLRVDVFDLLGRSLLNFASDGQEVQVLFPRENKFLRGPATPSNLAAFIPPGVTLAQVLRLLTADLPLSEGTPQQGEYQSAQDCYVLEWRRADGTLQERLWVEAKSLHPVKVEWYEPKGRLRFTAELSDFDRLARGRPQQIKLRTHQPDVELRVAYRELQLNPALSAADLVVSRPQGVVEVPLKP